MDTQFTLYKNLIFNGMHAAYIYKWFMKRDYRIYLKLKLDNVSNMSRKRLHKVERVNNLFSWERRWVFIEKKIININEDSDFGYCWK